MKRILIPIDGSPKSMDAVEQVRLSFSPKIFEVVLLMVCEDVDFTTHSSDKDSNISMLEKELEKFGDILKEYNLIKRTAAGKAGEKIIDVAEELKVDMIVMTKSTKTNLAGTIGMTASYVIRHAKCNILMVPDNRDRVKEVYRGLIYRQSSGNVTLRGQLSLKQSECLIPSVNERCNYHIEVKRGKIRIIHRSFNKDTFEWDLPPESGDREFYDIEEGESLDIQITTMGSSSRADRVRIINKNMKTEAVFSYKIENIR